MNLLARAWRNAGLFTGIAVAILAVAAPTAAQESDYRVYVANEFGADITVIDTATDKVIKSISISGRPGEVRPRGMA
ncbi:MAG TPA: hypothetical protein VL133_02790, partial [Devosia sp.]|nr:hypothetical protein [Devosia sp.]